MDGRAWFDHVLDPGWDLVFEDVLGGDPLRFPGYPEALEAARTKTGESESMLVAVGTLEGREVVMCSSVFGFMGGSMGAAHGERVCRAFELATERGWPLIAATASGGARMQEGMVALAQMPATLQARAAHAAAGLPMVALLRHPTTGGVFASYANAADRLLAIEGATIGFAGPRVAEAFTGEPLPEGSHTAEAAATHGLVHEVISATEARPRIAAALQAGAEPGPQTPAGRIRWRQARTRTVQAGGEDAWGSVTRSRDADRRAALRALFPASGHATVGGQPCVLIDTPLGVAPGVKDFRRARALMALAEAEGLPILVLVDLSGADPSAASEADGIAREISLTMSAGLLARVPTVALVTGEGGSGGALALCAGADRLGICEGAFFSVIAPEGAAAILRRADHDQVARDLACGPHALRSLGLADEVVADTDALGWVCRALLDLPA